MDSENAYRQRYEYPARRNQLPQNMHREYPPQPQQNYRMPDPYQGYQQYDPYQDQAYVYGQSQQRQTKKSQSRSIAAQHTRDAMQRVQTTHGQLVGGLASSTPEDRAAGAPAPQNDYAQASQASQVTQASHYSGAHKTKGKEHKSRDDMQSHPHPHTHTHKESSPFVGGFDPTVPGMPVEASVPFKPEESPEEQPQNPDPEDASHSIVLMHDESARVGHSGQAFPHVYADKPFFQLPQSNLILNPVPAYLSIDSRDRDRRVWPNSNHFRVPLVAPDNDPGVKSPNVRYKNIYSISLLSAVVPNLGGVFNDPFLLLQIDEIDDVYDAASVSCAKAFTKIYFKEVCALSPYLRMDKGVGDPLTKIYWPAPRASLESVTLSFRRADGTLIDFGPDAPLPGDPLPDRQTSITLEIRTFVVDSGKALGHRNP